MTATEPIPLDTSLSWCGSCGYVGSEATTCPECGAPVGKAKGGGIVEMPLGSIPCPQCGAEDKPIVFRGWARLYAFIYWAREGRVSGYLCVECGRKQTTISLFMTALLGWWSLPSIWHGPKVTYYNWRSIWAPPSDPLAWGAMGIRELLEASASGDSGGPDLEDDAAFEGSPLADLTFTERHVVLHVEQPYEALGIAIHATQAEVRTAFRQQAKASHPDINPGDASAAARMLEINQAYEVLGNPKLRVAFDWLQKDGAQL